MATRRKAQKGRNQVSNGEVFPGVPAVGPPGEIGNYQHHTYKRDSTGKPIFNTKAWANSDGSTTIVPDAYAAPGASPGFVSGYEIVQMGTLPDGTNAHTFWPFDPRVGFVDSHQKAEPLVVIAPDGTVTSPGYNPGTGHWIVGQTALGTEIVGVAPDQAALVPGAIDQARAALDALAALLGNNVRP